MFSPSPALSDKILIYSVCQFIQCLYAYQDRFHLSKLQLWTWSRGITHTADSCKLLPVGSITPLVLKLKLIVTKGCVFCLPWLGFYSCLASNLIFSFPFFKIFFLFLFFFFFFVMSHNLFHQLRKWTELARAALRFLLSLQCFAKAMKLGPSCSSLYLVFFSSFYKLEFPEVYKWKHWSVYSNWLQVTSI